MDKDRDGEVTVEEADAVLSKVFSKLGPEGIAKGLKGEL